ncbi:hypothetical protein [Xanthomonas axonopodis]|uniref:hypothetical protein n=1 Tax=Xanthomonas axonopodis TaxID=53413 RepID=UPI00209A981F|nr:hypothetical protein [Xanthomonas axonopodis]
MNDVTGSFGNTVVEQGQTLKGARPMLQASRPTARSGLGSARVAGNNVLRLKAMATLPRRTCDGRRCRWESHAAALMKRTRGWPGNSRADIAFHPQLNTLAASRAAVGAAPKIAQRAASRMRHAGPS